MTRQTVADQVRGIVADEAKVQAASIDESKRPDAYGLDSLRLLILRERLERVLGLHLSDRVWLDLASIGSLIDYIHQSRSGGATTAAAAAQTPAAAGPEPSGVRRPRPGLMVEDVEVGMPLTGRNNLAEGPLLQRLGDIRWRHLSSIMGVRSRDVVDADGDRLYPTFFFVHVAFPAQQPMGMYRENDVFTVVDTLSRFGTSMLDGTSYLIAPGANIDEAVARTNAMDSARAGIPAVRMSNIFVKQFGGAEWLKKSRPASAGFTAIPELAFAPDSYAIVKEAERLGAIEQPGEGWLPLTQGPVRREYQLVPDRDLNGAGLVYFANYPVFLDIAERSVLAESLLPLPHPLIDKRTLRERRSAYLNNASSRDLIQIDSEVWIRDPRHESAAAPELAPVRLWINSRMSRSSDGRVMMVSTAEKVLLGVPIEETPFLEWALAQQTKVGSATGV